MRTQAIAFAPASVSNVACGFDIMGFALEGAGDRVTVRRVPGREIRIVRIAGCAIELPREVELNTAGPPVLEVARRSGYDGGLEIEIQKSLPIGSGIGSSAASAVAAAVAADAVLEARLPRESLLECAMAGEQVASGAKHADNLAPSLWGGFTLVRSTSPLDVVPLVCARPLWCTLLLPSMSINTKQSRQLLPCSIPLADVVTQTANAAGLVAGLLQGDLDLISRSLHDRIAEPVRRNTIPGYAAVKQAALDSGALGCNISGSGPAIFALCATEEVAQRTGEAMRRAFGVTGIGSSSLISNIATTGARIVG